MIDAGHLMVEFEVLVFWEVVNLLSFPNLSFATQILYLAYLTIPSIFSYPILLIVS